MLSSGATPQPGRAVSAEVSHLIGLLLGGAVHCVLGLLLAMGLARVLRARHLHWSWAATLVAPVAVEPALLGGWGLTLAVAGASAVVWGRRWHREDLDVGADLARIARERRTPLGVVVELVRRAELRRRVAASHVWLGRRSLLLGADERSRPISIPFGGEAGARHTLVVGATGSGKTITQTWLAVRAIERGMGAIVVDPKGDRGMRDELLRAARGSGRRFIEWTPDGPAVYNPYARGSESQIADKALAGERFTEPHYLRQAQRYLGHVVRALRAGGSLLSLQSVVECLDPDRLEVLVRELPESQAQPTHAYLDGLTTRQRNDLAGVRDRLAILTESDVGRWLDPRTSGAERFDLLGSVLERAVVYFNLESDCRPLLTQILGAAIVQDLQTTVASLQDRPTPALVVIDEFSAIAVEQVVRLFARARSAGLSLVLGTQEICDLRPPGRERLLEQVMGNLSVLIAHRQVVPSSAELISSLAGTTGAWRGARHDDGRTTRSRNRERVLDPDRVMRLERGCGAVMVLDGPERVRVGRILAPGPLG
jgi:TraM recognition site of TraD and TraG/Type IV secretion-system coupling protein DNA-binding domain